MKTKKTSLFTSFNPKATIFAILALLFITIQSIETIYENQFSADLIGSIAFEGKVINPDSWLNGWYDWQVVILIVGMSIGGFIFGLLGVYFSSIAATEYIANLRKSTFSKIQKFSPKEIDSFSTSSLVTRLTTDMQTIFLGLTFGLRFLTKGLSLFFYGLGLSIADYQQLSIIYAILIPLLFIVILFAVSRAIPYFLKTQKNTDGVNKAIRESVYGVRVLKAFNLEPKRKEIFNDRSVSLMKSATKAFTIVALLMPIIQTAINMAVVSVYYVASLDPRSVKDIIGFINILNQVLFGFIVIIMVFVQISSAIPSFRRVKEVLDKEISVQFDESSNLIINNGEIEFKNVSYRFHENSAPVLSNLNFKILNNQKIGIIGRTGSGKSTLINLIARFFDPSEGEVVISESNIKNYTFDELNKNVAIATQESVLFFGTVRSNIAMGVDSNLDKKEKEKQIIEAAKIADAYNFVSSKEEGFDSKVEQRGKNFSGGQKQRISIARTVAKKSKIIIFDDSTSALDNITEKKVQSNMASSFDATTIIVAQRISSVENLDKIMVMENGELIGFDTHKNLLVNNGIYRDIALSQWGQTKFNEEVKKAKGGK